MERGEIRWYRFKEPDKKRPIVILTRNSILPYLHSVTVAPITSTVRDIPTEVFLSKEDGMKKGCVINYDNIQTVLKSKLGEIMTTLNQQKLAELNKAVQFALELE